MKYKCEELKIICDNKEKIIKKFEESQMEQIDIKKEDENMNNKIYILLKENEELRLGLHNMTEGINQANKLYNQKLGMFKKEIIIKNNKLNEYKNKISVLKNKILELYNELILIKGIGINNNSYYNANFFNNSIISNSNSASKNKEKPINFKLMVNKNYSNSNTRSRLNTEYFHNNENKIPNLDNIITYRSVKRNNNNNNIHKFNSMRNLNNQRKNNLKMKTMDNQDYINENNEENTNSINFLKKYKEALDKFQSFK